MRKFLFAAAISWTAAIGILCLVSLGDLPSEVNVTHVDKIAHFVFHFGFTFLWCSYLKTNSELSFKVLARIVMLSIVYGITLEFAQEQFTAARQASLIDVVANLCGALVAAFFFVRIKRQNIID